MAVKVRERERESARLGDGDARGGGVGGGGACGGQAVVTQRSPGGQKLAKELAKAWRHSGQKLAKQRAKEWSNSGQKLAKERAKEWSDCGQKLANERAKAWSDCGQTAVEQGVACVGERGPLPAVVQLDLPRWSTRGRARSSAAKRGQKGRLATEPPAGPPHPTAARPPALEAGGG